MEGDYNLKNVREAINGIYESYPPDRRTPEIRKLLDELYKIERDLNPLSKCSITNMETGK